MGAQIGFEGRRRVASLARLVAALLLVLSSVDCAPDAARPERRHESLEAFAAESASEASRRRVVLIGLDGASWDYLEPRFAEGELPNLARVAREGSIATLQSVECHFTPPAWTSMFTGVLPSRHGVYSFGSWDPTHGDFAEVTSADVVAPPLWELVSRAGLRVAAVGVPVSYPASPLEGVMVSGLMTPKSHRPPLALTSQTGRPIVADPALQSFSPPQGAVFEDSLNVFRIRFTDGIDDGELRYDRVHLEVMKKGLGAPARRLLGRYDFPVGRYSSWVRVRVAGPAQHREGWTRIRVEAPVDGVFDYHLSPIFEPIRRPFTWPESLAAELEERFGYYLPHEFLSLELLPEISADAAAHARFFLEREPWDVFLYVFGQSDNAHHLVGFAPSVLPVYREIDAFVGEVLERADDETIVVIASDHGFGPYDSALNPNQVLARHGLLSWQSPGVIDHERSLVFHNMWHLYFDRALLTREELVQRGVPIGAAEDPRAALTRHLSRLFRELRSDDGEPLPVEVVALPEDAVGNAPDMAVHGSDRYWIDFWNVDRPSDEIVRPLAGDERWKHAPDGILAFWGRGIPGGRDLGRVDIQDVAPTLLDLLGLPVADDLDGVVIEGLLEPGADRGRPLHRVASYGARTSKPLPVPEDSAPFAEMLKALGYVRD